MAYLHKLSYRLALLNDAMTLLVTLGAAACERPLAVTSPSGGGSVPVASVTLSLASASLTAGRTVQLTATPKDANGNPLSGRVITWTSSAAGVATVSGSGLVTGVAVGSATITATSEGQSGTAAFTVTNVPVAAVTVSPATASVVVGQTVQLTATPKDANGNPLSGRVITWTSSAAGVATVSGSGLVTGVAVGSATITATSEGQSGTAAVTVSVPPPPPPGGSWPNEPAGFTQLTDRSFAALLEDGWQQVPANNPYYSIQVDASAPQSPPYVGEALFPAGFGSGSAPIQVWKAISGYTKLYLAFWWKESANWYGNRS